VSTIIPGASKPEQVSANVEALNSPDLSEEQLFNINAVYDKYIKKSVHQLW
jgi:aryl-alcohol dehydrogenase-like predicted oxidoreductase